MISIELPRVTCPITRKAVRWLHHIFVFVMVLLPACSNIKPPPSAAMVAQPKARPIHNVTSFDQSLRCMDDLFVDYGVKNVVITSQGIPDATGEIRTGTKEMLISAISHMSTHSGAFRFVDYDQRQFDINELQKLVGFTKDFLVPNYYIRGAITQFDEQVQSQSKSGGVSLKVFDAGSSRDKVTSLVSIDLNVGNLLTRQILSGTSANNTIAVSRTGRSTDASGSIDMIDLGFSFNMNVNHSEGMHQSVRTLLQLSTIESLGKLTEVPYWRCLGIGQTSTAMMEQAQGWYHRMSSIERLKFVQRALAGMELYSGPSEGGQATPALHDAIGQYQSAQGLMADGQINFQLYASLIGDELALGEAPKSLDNQENRVFQSQVADAIAHPLDFSVTTLRGDNAFYSVGDSVSLTLKVSEDAFVYCYYEDKDHNVARLYPNRFQPNALLSANAALSIPGAHAQFEIVMEEAGTEEEVLCMASREELGIRLPKQYKQDDLVPLQIGSLEEVASTFSALEQTTTVDQRIRMRVRL